MEKTAIAGWSKIALVVGQCPLFSKYILKCNNVKFKSENISCRRMKLPTHYPVREIAMLSVSFQLIKIHK